jgi:hypothetical protein
MDEHVVSIIEEFFNKKIMLYGDLLHCFIKERESLTSVDLDSLWKISNEKESICSEIVSMRREIALAADPGRSQTPFNLNRIMDLIPIKFKPKFQKFYMRLTKYKIEIEALRKENSIFINDALLFLDELISIITGQTKSEMVYNEQCHFLKPGSYLCLDREV